MIKEAIRETLSKAGFLVLKSAFMPNGISLSRDVSKDFPLHQVNTIFDVGASIGEMSIYFRKNFPHARIHAFEPVKSTFQILQKNTKSLGNFQAHQFAFSDTEGSFKLYLQSNSGLNSINPLVNVADHNNENATEVIQLKTIDAFCKDENIKSIELLKTDAEGADLRILQGAVNMIRSGRVKYVLSEVGFHEDNVRNTPFDALKSFLFSHNYKLKAFYDQSDYGNKPHITCANALFRLQD
jgi:FkbM family methyltransferase